MCLLDLEIYALCLGGPAAEDPVTVMARSRRMWLLLWLHAPRLRAAMDLAGTKWCALHEEEGASIAWQLYWLSVLNHMPAAEGTCFDGQMQRMWLVLRATCAKAQNCCIL